MTSMSSSKRWVGSWAAAPAPAEGVAGFNNQTIRLNPRLSIGGERLRVRISNAYGNRPLTIGAATVALRDKGPAVVAGTGRKLSFGLRHVRFCNLTVAKSAACLLEGFL